MTEIVSDDGLMRACNSCKKGGVFYGGSARMVQDALGISGDKFLYVGDHIYTDAALAKLNFKCDAPSQLCPCRLSSCMACESCMLLCHTCLLCFCIFLQTGTHHCLFCLHSNAGQPLQVANRIDYKGTGGRDRSSGEGPAIPQEAESVAEEEGNHRCHISHCLCFQATCMGHRYT